MIDKMDRLWAPWRIKYIQKKFKGCLFCKVVKERRDKKNYLIYRGKHAFSILNIFPYNNGHILVSPYKHVGSLEKLNSKEVLDLFEILLKTKSKLDKILKPEGYNIGINIGKVAGAGFPMHLHIHLVPRWNGDTNFMSVISQTKVLSQSLKELYNNLTK